MRLRIQPALPSLACLAAIVAMLAGCGPSQSAADKAVPVEIRGEPINSTNANADASPVATNSPVATSSPKPAEAVDGYPSVGFDKLASYNFEVNEDGPVTNLVAGAADKANDQIPDTVKALDRKKVSLKGFMLPLKVESGVVTEFLLLKDQSMCCYGNVPKITEWVSVKTAGKGLKAVMDQPVSILGTLHIGALRENGYLVGIYQMDGEKMVTSGDN